MKMDLYAFLCISLMDRYAYDSLHPSKSLWWSLCFGRTNPLPDQFPPFPSPPIPLSPLPRHPDRNASSDMLRELNTLHRIVGEGCVCKPQQKGGGGGRGGEDSEPSPARYRDGLSHLALDELQPLRHVLLRLLQVLLHEDRPDELVHHSVILQEV